MRESSEPEMPETTPIWLRLAADQEIDWPTSLVTSDDLHYAVPLPDGWSQQPEVVDSPLMVEHVYRGALRGESLSVAVIENADQSGELGNWVEAGIAVLGVPDLAGFRPRDADAKMLELRRHGASSDLAERLAVDEALSYDGLAMLPGSPPELLRFYIIVARRGSLTWKAAITISSACLPGESEDMVLSNDHVRAGATLAGARFGPPGDD